MVIASSVTGYTWQTNHLWGAIHGGISLLMTILFILRAYSITLRPISQNLHGYALLITLALSTGSFAVSIPASVIPSLRLKDTTTPYKSITTPLSTEFVERSLSNITQVLSAAENRLEQEKEKVDYSVATLLDEFHKRNKQLVELEKKQRELETEVEQYQLLASVTDEQARAIRGALQRGKYIDYLAGFLIGLISSAVFHLLSTFIKKERVESTAPN
jgi:hypothetical protein